MKAGGMRGPQGIQGERGPQGEQGAVGNDKNFTLPFTNSSEVTVAHNLSKLPAVTIIDSTGDEVVGDIEYISVNQIIARFSSSFSVKGRPRTNTAGTELLLGMVELGWPRVQQPGRLTRRWRVEAPPPGPPPVLFFFLNCGCLVDLSRP